MWDHLKQLWVTPQELYSQGGGDILPFNLKIMRSDVDKYIEADEEWIKANQKVKYLETIVDFLDRTLRQISNRTFTIKNAIDWRKFTSGAI